MKRDHAGDTRPDPDPTRLTTEALTRELDHAMQIMDLRFDGVNASLARLDEERNRMDHLHEHKRELLRDGVLRQVLALERLIDERFARVWDRFGEMQASTRLAAEDGRVQLKTALDAAKEAVGEQNKYITQSLNRLEEQWTRALTNSNAVNDERFRSTEARLLDMKERMDQGTGGQQAVATVRDTSRLNINTVLMVLALIAAVIIPLMTRGT